MGRRSRARSDDLDLEDHRLEDQPNAGFPLVIAGLSTAAAVLLFFSGTIPAMVEERHLLDVEARRAQVHRDLWRELDAEGANRLARRIDIQSVLVELDRRGVDTRPVLFPEPPPSIGRGTDPHPEAGRKRDKPPIRDRR